MLRFFYIIFDILCTICAVVAPIAIVHWLLIPFDLEALVFITEPLGNIFAPLNSMVEDAMPWIPHIYYREQDISTAQGILALISTGFFFLFSYISTMLKNTEKKVDAVSHTRQSIKVTKSIEKEVEKEKKAIIKQSKRFLLLINYEFDVYKQVDAWFNNHAQHEGSQLQLQNKFALYEFNDVTKAISFATSLAGEILEFYKTLRPMDPQPPFFMAVHTVDIGEENTYLGLERCNQITRFTKNNNISFSKDVCKYLKASELDKNYTFHSLGFYELSTGHNEEVFKLTYIKAPNAQSY